MAEIIYRKTVDLDPLYHNPRFIRDNDFKSLCASMSAPHGMKHFEARPIILSNRTGLRVIIAGNMRHKAAIELGIKEVPTVLLEGLTEEEEQEIIIRDNVNNGSWDFDILANEWNKDQLVEWGVPALWDLKGEDDEEPKEPSSAKIKLTIEFESELQRKESRTLIEEALRGTKGWEIK